MEHEYSFLYIILRPLLEGLPAGIAFLKADHIVMVTFVTVLLLVALPLIAARLRPDNRGGLQQTFEVAYEAISGMVRERVHHGAERHVPLIATFGLVILIFNLSGAVPFFTSPTPNLNTTVALALVSFLYYNWQGIREHGPIGYAKTFMGPTAALAPIMFVSELISHLARILSLSLRLAASMGADHVVVGAFTLLFPFLVPAPMVGLGMLMAGLQTFIFVLLSTVYLGGALAKEH